MADILICGMEMPKNCRACRFAGFGGMRNELKVCMFSGESQSLLSHERMSKCPLVPLPEGHGRIVDASVAEKKIKEMYMTMVNSHEEGSTEVALGLHLAASIIRTDTNVPTIVPAEGTESE